MTLHEPPPVILPVFTWWRRLVVVKHWSRLVAFHGSSRHSSRATTNVSQVKSFSSLFHILLVYDSIYFNVKLIKSVEKVQRNNNLGKIKLSIWFVCLSLPSFVLNWWRRTPRILRSLSLGARRWSCRQYISACAYCLTIRMRTCPRPACELRTL